MPAPFQTVEKVGQPQANNIFITIIKELFI